MEYWEIWNEPECFSDPKKSSTWGGTGEQFDHLYEITAKHLKATCPGIKVGGPALAWNLDPWGLRFLGHQKATGAPLDFFSWHIYAHRVKSVTDKAVCVRKALNEHGFADTESILNEWNYNRSFSSGFATSTRWRRSGKGAAFASAVMCACQAEPVDMLMYYDARPVLWNGIFDGSNALKTYWAFWAWRELVRRGTAVACASDEPDVFVAGAKDVRGKFALLVTRFNDDENVIDERTIEVRLQGGEWKAVRAYMTDEQTMNCSPCPFEIAGDVFRVKMSARAFVFIENLVE